MARDPFRVQRNRSARFLYIVGLGVLLVSLIFLLNRAFSRAGRGDGYTDSTPRVRRRGTFEAQLSEDIPILSQTIKTINVGSGAGLHLPLATAADATLVVYLYSNSDPVYLNNLNYFIRRGVAANDGCEYVIVIQGDTQGQATATLPALPPNAQYYHGTKEACPLGWGMLGEVLRSNAVRKDKFKYFVFLNSSVRGPFIPTYILGDRHWTQFFTQKLLGKTKLVGPTISCQEPIPSPDANVNVTSTAYVQFTVVATDKEGLAVLEDDSNVFQCHNSTWQEQYYSEMGSARTLLRHNFTIDCFMTRYRKVDWTEPKNWECNQRKNPIGEFAYDGTSTHPYETMFVVMDTVAIENGWSFAKLAALYETWLMLQDQGTNDVTTNLWITDPWPIKRQRIAYMQSRGPGCFDNRYYLQKNPDLKVIPTVLELWDHFVMMGQFEGRSFRQAVYFLPGFPPG